MMRSLFSGVSGLRNHQTRMDVIGNNIANVNTIGFKTSRVNFQDVLSQTIQGASAPGTNRGGTNPMQVGLGMGLSSIDTVFTDGSFQPTGKQSDLSIQGQGFFVLSNGNSQIFTRAGNFDFDELGNYLVPGTGYKVMGWTADNNGVVNAASPIGAIQIPVGVSMPARVSTVINYVNNLSATATPGTSTQCQTDAYDSLGLSHKVTETYTKVGPNRWLVQTAVPDATTPVTNPLKEVMFDSTGAFSSIRDVTPTGPLPTATVTFGAAANFRLNSTNGSVSNGYITVFDATNNPHVLKMSVTRDSVAGNWRYSVSDTADATNTQIGSGLITEAAGTYTFAPANFNVPALGGAALAIGPVAGTASAAGAFAFNQASPYTTTTPAGNIAFSVGGGADPMSISLNMSKLTGNNEATSIQARDTDGYAAGTLQSTTIDPTGSIIGNFSNGRSRTLAQVALATFNNPAGLNKVGENLYAQSTNSGTAQVGLAGTGGRGRFQPGTLEMSNVDLANEFSNMIITQRGFQANSKIITTTDEMLQDLANLKR